MMWYWTGGMNWWGWLVGSTGLVAFWGLVVWAVSFFATGGSRRPEEGPRPDEAKRILDERFAQGELDAEEYRQRREIIESGSGRPTVGTGARS